MLRHHGGALEADFERYYGRDVLDVYRGTLSLRKASNLALMLPPGAITWQEAGTDSAWTITDHLLADVLDALNTANWQRGQDGNRKRPDPVPRPRELREKREKREREMQRASRFLERQRARREAK